MKTDINYPIIFLAVLVMIIIVAATIAICSEVSDHRILKESGISAEVPIIDKNEEFQLVGKVFVPFYYITTKLPNGEITEEEVGHSEYDQLEVGDMINVCYYNDISRINFNNCAS